MTAQVYRHRVRRSTDILLARAILLAAEEGIANISALFTYDGPSAAFCSRWLEYVDNRLLDEILERGASSRARRLVSALRLRRLPSHVFTKPLREFHTLYQGSLKDRKEQDALEEKIANACSLDRDMVVVDLVRTEPPRPSSSEPSIDPQEILVDDGTDEPKRFSDVSTIFTGNPLTGKDDVTVYIPLGPTAGARRRARKKMEPLVMDAIEARGKEVLNGR